MKKKQSKPPHRKPAEERALLSLRRALISRGIQPYFDPDIVDNPDAVLILGQRRVAVECTYITPQRMLEAFRYKAERLNMMYRVVVPYEPHLWVSRSVEMKNKKLQTYLDRGRAEEGWLLLHTSGRAAVLRNLGGITLPLVTDLLRVGAQSVPHKFQRIWLSELGDDPPRMIELYGPGVPRPAIGPDDILSSEGNFPAIAYMQGQHVVTAVTKTTVSYELTDANVKTFFLEPLDPRHVIDKTMYAEPIATFVKRIQHGYIQRGPFTDY